MRPKEIVYLSFGSTANHVATHFWNTQQTYFDYSPHAPPPIVEHDVSFKAGLGTDGLDTYTPRTLLFDVREEFGALARINALYEESSEDAFDGETLETVPRVQPSAMADALTAPATATKHEGPPRYWSDFAQTPYHPKSLLHVAAPSLYGHSFLSSMGTDSLNPTFDTFAQGVRVAKAMEDEQQVMEDTLRWWAEDSDLLQGFQMTTSSSDAFAGFSHTYLQYVADEYPKSERHVALLGRAYEAKYQPYVTMNNILSLVHFYEQASMLVPIRMSGPTTDFLRPDWNSMYENSAVLAALFESATLPLRYV
ncbi:mitochondrion organization protein [Malassezia pachydermatis]